MFWKKGYQDPNIIEKLSWKMHLQNQIYIYKIEIAFLKLK